MTREEAIKTLKENYCVMCAYGSQDMDSCDIRSCDNKDAIKALEQDTVSKEVYDHEYFLRKELEDEERKYLHDLKMDGAEHIVVHHARRIVEDMPSVIPHPKIGHWIDKFGGVYRCSCCREIISIDTEIEFPNGITYKYCPNCGCRMADTQESEDKE